MSVIDDVVGGDIRAAARLMRDLDDRLPRSVELLKQLHRHSGRAAVIGMTGNPGCGKSTLVDALIGWYRQQGQRVGVLAIDPSSPFSGGAILGDRIRMQRHALDDNVFIRSIASRGYLGGLSRSTTDIIAVLDAMGFDMILVETVGVGQAEVDIVEAAHVSVVVVVPGLGDEIQTMKAGILEIADILCLNKADSPGADRTLQDLEQMLGLRGDATPRPPIISTVATSRIGIPELAQAVNQHLHRQNSPARQAWLVKQARRQVENLLHESAAQKVLERLGDRYEELILQVARREIDPYTLVEQILTQHLSNSISEHRC